MIVDKLDIGTEFNQRDISNNYSSCQSSGMRLGNVKTDLDFTFSQTKFVSIIFSDITISPNVQVTFLSSILGRNVIIHLIENNMVRKI